MAWEDIFRVIGASLFSIVSAGALVAGLASWLGKVWAERIVRNETHDLKKKLAEAQHKLDLSIKAAERELDLIRDAHARVHNDKITIYRGVIDLVAKLLANLDAFHMGAFHQSKLQNNTTSSMSSVCAYMGTWPCLRPSLSWMRKTNSLITY